MGGREKIFFGGSGGIEDVDEGINVSEANFFVSEASNLSAGAKISRGLYYNSAYGTGLKIMVPGLKIHVYPFQSQLQSSSLH